MAICESSLGATTAAATSPLGLDVLRLRGECACGFRSIGPDLVGDAGMNCCWADCWYHILAFGQAMRASSRIAAG